jgi:hypothetical protein
MAEYIEREALKNDIAKNTEPFNTGSVFRAINRQIAADVAPVVHGLWVEHLDEMECSVCKRQWNYCDNDTNTFNFCPNCGAKMDGGADNEAD